MVIYHKNIPVTAAKVNQIIGDIPPSVLDTALQHQVYRGEGGNVVQPLPVRFTELP